MRIAVLDDYQGVALSSADWTPVTGHPSRPGRVDVFRDHLAEPDALVDRLEPYDAVVVMRERTPLPASVLTRLSRLGLVVTTGRRNPSIDVAAATASGITVCGTESRAGAPAELTWALVLGLSRHLVTEATAVREGGWQTTVGRDLDGHTMGILGLGRLGTRVAAVARAFGMDVLAWSPHLTAERATAAGASAAPLDTVLRRSDVVSVHLPLVEGAGGTRGLVGARELRLMRPGALLVNTSRGPIVDETALLDALASGHLGGAGLDVFDTEPLPLDHPLRTAPRTLLTPHVGYVTEDTYATFFSGVVEALTAWLDGNPVRVL